MEGNIDKDCSALGGLFQTIVNDMRASSMIWEDFTNKATKLHTQLKATIGAIGGFLEVFQKVADMATGSRGATKDIGSALTRLCMRHKSIEAKLKALTGSILDNLVIPVQEHSEEWKKTVIQLDKDHAKEYKKARQEIKKAASDTMRLQKKVKKGKSEQNKLDNAMIDVNNKYMALEDTEKNAIRKVLIEERSRYCLFVSCVRPFVDHELGLLTEITHLQEIMDHLCMQCNDPHTLPPASEQVIMDLKGFDSNSVWNFSSQPSPPSSPSSIGSRKSSMCSISSINSSSSGSIKSHSPSHLNHKRVSAQQLPMGTARLTSVSSQDSGFTSQDTLFQRPATPTSLNIRQKDPDNTSTGDNADNDSQSSTPSDNTPSASSTWTTWPNPPSQGNKVDENRPHTISSAYEKNHTRPALNPNLFEPPPQESPELEEEEEEVQMRNAKKKHERSHSGSTPYSRPQSATINKMQPVLPPLAPKPRSKAVPPPKVPVLASVGETPTYVNMNDLANMAKEQQKESMDSDHTPTEKSPPTVMSHPQMKKNSMELAKAIKELEASTAELQSTYDSSTSQQSLQCSSGYGTMNSSPANSQDTIATGGIPVSHATGGSIMRRSSMNTPKPPPPVRRSSSISTANPVTLQKLRKTPPRQLNSGPGQQGVQQQQYRTSHRRSNSSGSESEPAYAELQTIQQSIQARQSQHQQQEATPYATTATQNIAYSAPPTPSQYAHPNTMPPPGGNYSQQQQPAGQVALMQKLNAQFSALNAAYKEEDLPPPPPDLQSIDPDLPPPPTVEELEEIEKVYSRPQSVNPRPTQHNQGELRASLVSELKLGLRKMSADEGSEC